ncbi:cytochrome P450 [Whalleya microplaca]|nr:cytochrome P450 [Whalleya microplaca]
MCHSVLQFYPSRDIVESVRLVVFKSYWSRCALFIFLLFLICVWFVSGRRPLEHSYTVPYTLPFLKSTIPFAFDGLRFLGSARRRFPDKATFRISIVQDDVYLIQGPKNISEVFHNAHLTVTRAYSLVLRQCFGMGQKSVNAYLADTSGSRQKPIPGSSPRLQDRISFMTHENLVSGLLKEGLGPASRRFEIQLARSLQAANIGDDWIEFADMAKFFELHLGSSLISTLFGEELLAQHPNFIEDLWEYDKGVMNLARRLPWLWMPRTYKIRDKLLTSVEKWHSKVLACAGFSQVSDDPEADLLWGTKMVRERYPMLLGATGQDEKSVASTDLAFIWATVTNVIPSSMTLALHVFRSQPLLSSLRTSLSQLSPSPTIEDLETVPLLLSMYAETLRFGVQIHIPRSAPYHDLHVGGVAIPKNKLIMTNTWLMHTDENTWNTKGGEQPLDHFWAERFLVDPKDATSGPMKMAGSSSTEQNGKGEVYFSTAGLEGAWIPYGGGHHACPGRLLAKRIMLLSTAMLINRFDVEILADERALAFDSPRFGFGVRKPRRPVRFRMRRRK